MAGVFYAAALGYGINVRGVNPRRTYMVKVLFLGDVVGKVGRRLVAARATALAREHSCDLVAANVENIAGGAGVTPEKLTALVAAGIDVATSGNHVFAKPEALTRMGDMPRLVRPANYPPATPGRGWLSVASPTGVEVAVVNLQGRVFMSDLDCPFRTADSVLGEIAEVSGAKVIIVDFHAEATSEKEAMGRYLDGRVTAVVGTHTHVQTADERVLPGGTAYLTDVGMTGPSDGIIGTRSEPVLKRFLSQLPARFEPATGGGIIGGAVITADDRTGRAIGIQRIQWREEGTI